MNQYPLTTLNPVATTTGITDSTGAVWTVGGFDGINSAVFQ